MPVLTFRRSETLPGTHQVKAADLFIIEERALSIQHLERSRRTVIRWHFASSSGGRTYKLAKFRADLPGHPIPGAHTKAIPYIIPDMFVSVTRTADGSLEGTLAVGRWR